MINIVFGQPSQKFSFRLSTVYKIVKSGPCASEDLVWCRECRDCGQYAQKNDRQALAGSRLTQTDIYFWVGVFRVVAIGYLRGGNLIAVWVHGGQQVDACVVDKVLDALISQQVLRAQVLSQVDEQLPAQNFIPMHVPDQLNLRLHYRIMQITRRSQ